MSRIRVLATSDVHGYIYPYDYATNDEKNMGLAKLSDLINSLRDENTIVIDNGDSLEGSPLSFYHFHSGNKIHPVTKAFKFINYDYINLGNHDFNYGKEALFNHLHNLDGKCITCNVEPLGFTYDIKLIEDKKIGIFGIVTDYIPNWEKPENIEGLVFKDAFTTTKKIVKELRDKVDYLICVYHGGFEKDLETFLPTENLTGENIGSKILEEIEGIDILISGHQHRSLALKVKNTVVTQTASNGYELACIDIEDKQITARLLNPTVVDQRITKEIENEEDMCQKWLDTVIGTCVNDLQIKDEDDARLHKHQIITFLNHVARYYSKADLAGSALFINAKGFKKEITVRDIVSTYVYPNSLYVKKIDGKNLKLYLEKCAEFFDIENDQIVVSKKYIYPKLQHFNYDMVDGIDYEIKVGNKIGERITSLKFQGKDVKDDDIFTLAINNYRAGGGGDFEMIKSLETVKEITTGMVEMLIDYIGKYKVIDFEEVHNIRVIK